MKRGPAYLFLALATVPAPLLAQASRETGDPPREILVTGDPLPETTGDSVQSQVLLDPDRQAGSALRLENLLSATAGFQPFRRADTRSSHPTANGLALRGLGGNAASRAPVLLDGVPIADPFGGWISWNAVDPLSLKSVAIDRGGGAVAVGPGALTGVISLESQGATRTSEAAVAYGSRDAAMARGLIARALGNGAMMFSARVDRGDGYSPVAAGQRGPVDRPAPYRSFSVRARGIAPLAGGELQAQIGIFGDERDRGTAFTRNDQTGSLASIRYVRDENWDIEALAYFQLRDFKTNFARVSDDRRRATEALDQNTASTGTGAKIEIRPPSSAPIRTRFGADVSLVDGTTRELASFQNARPTLRRRAGGRNANLGLYAEGDWNLSDRLLLTAGMRGDLQNRSNGRLIETSLLDGTNIQRIETPDRNDFFVSGRIGARFSLTERVALRGAAYRSFRHPTLNELYRPYRVGADGIAANPVLASERLTGAEVGIDWESHDGAWKASLTGFHARLDGAITDVTLSVASGPPVDCPGVGRVFGACQQRQNIDAVRSDGLELDLRYANSHFNVGLSGALTDARIRSSGAAAALKGKRPAQVPKAAAGISMGWRPNDSLRFDADLRWQGRRFEDEANSRALNAVTRLDLGAEYRIADSWWIGTNAENIFDAEIQTGISSDGIIERAQPRTIWASIRFSK